MVSAHLVLNIVRLRLIVMLSWAGVAFCTYRLQEVCWKWEEGLLELMNGCQPQGTLHVLHVMSNENFFWREKIDQRVHWGCFYIFSFSGLFPRTYAPVSDSWQFCIVKSFYVAYTMLHLILLKSASDRVAVIIKHYQHSCHARTCVSLAPCHLCHLQTQISFIFLFFFGTSIIFSGFHHLFPERPVLLNWHPNMCWPVH